MRKILSLLILLCLVKALHAQQPYVYTIKADSVKITNTCDTAELIIENHTQNVPGFLFNKGRGRTEFRQVVALNDSMLVVGGDTLVLRGSSTASNGLSMIGKDIRLGQSIGATNNPAALNSNREIPLNGFNTVFTGIGKVGIGTNSPVQSLSVTGSFGVTSANGYTPLLSSGFPATAYISQGSMNWGLNIQRHSPNIGGPILTFFKNRSGDPNVKLALQKGDNMGSFSYHGVAGDNSTVHFPAEWLFIADSITSNQVRGFFVFRNTSWSGSYGERFRISANGNITIGSGYADDRLLVQGTGRVDDTLKLPNIIAKNDTVAYKPMVVDANGNVFKMSGWNTPQLTRTAVNDAGYSTLTSDYLIAYTSLTAARTITLPAASGMTNHILIVKDESGAAATYNITVNVTAGGTIDGAASKVINTNYGSIEMYSNGSQWFTK